MLRKLFNSITENEISLKYLSLLESLRAIALSGVLGVLVTFAYIAITPNQYQANAKIQMAQIGSSAYSPTPSGINVEEPNLLILRLMSPTAYSAQEIRACGFENASSPNEALKNAVKFSALKGVNTLVELQVKLASKEAAIACANAIFEAIKIYQYLLIKPYIEESKALQLKYEKKLGFLQAMISRADESGAVLSATYLATYDERKFLTEEIFRLNRFVTMTEKNQAMLFTPIYASDAPVFPNSKISLMFGFMSGSFLGLLFVLGREFLKNKCNLIRY